MNARPEENQPEPFTRRAGDVAEAAEEQAERLSERAAEGIQRIAEVVRERSEETPYIPTAAAGMAAHSMEEAADYMRRRGALGAAADLQGGIRSHPMLSVAGALVAGYVIGRLVR